MRIRKCRPKKNYKYLGKRVRDVGKCGLDSLSEVRGIVAEIIKDYKTGKITYRTAMSRMNLLSLIVTKAKAFKAKKKTQKKAKLLIKHGRKILQKLRRT